MTVFPPDNRRVIQPSEQEFDTFPLPAVTAIDTTIFFNDGRNPEAGFGSGIVISPNYVLSAAHNFYPEDVERNQDEIRVSNSTNQLRLNDRRIGEDPNDIGDLDVNVRAGIDGDIFYPTNWRSTFNLEDDIAFVKTVNNALISPSPSVGLISFVNPKDAEDYEIQTAGYPIDNVTSNIPGNSGQETRDLVLAPGSFSQFGTIEIMAGRRMQYSKNIDTFSGQSGSPVWHTLEGDNVPRVLGVHSMGGNVGNFGASIAKDIYDEIISQIEGDGDPNILPENAIIGSDITSDQIDGTYRKERILGLGGDDTISGAGADDRLEGNEGNDELDGGAGDDILTGGAGDDLIDGGTNTLAIINPFNRENDVAVYSADISEYNIEINTSGGVFGSPIGAETVAVITHLNNGVDGEDTLTNIEFLQFADGTVPLASDDDVIDDLINFVGGSDDDELVGNVLDNLLRGGSGNDMLHGDSGDDTLKGDGGNDTLFGQNDDDVLQGSFVAIS